MSVHVFNTVGRLLSEKYFPISASQKYVLEQFFAKNEYPSRSSLQNIAEKLGLGEKTVYNWFRCTRLRVRIGKCLQYQSIGEFFRMHTLLVSIKIMVNSHFPSSERLITLYLGKLQCGIPIRISDKQNTLLKQSFASDPNPKMDKCQKLSEQLGMKERTVYNWFRTERRKVRKAENQLVPKGRLISVSFLCMFVFINGKN